MQRFDMVVIGGGSTGIAAAYRVARAGRRVAVIDKGPMGGLCSLAGCNPKKVLVCASEVLQTVRDAAVHGVSAGELSVDWETVWKRKHSFTDPVPESTDKSLAAAGIARIHGVARFIDAETIAVGDGTFQADAFVIATGSHPRNLDFHGAAALKTSNDALELKEPPKRMSIIGSGVVAFEFSHVFARLGTKITMLMRDHGGLSGFDDDFSRIALEFARDHLGITFVPNADFTSIEWNDAGFVLNAAGRVAAIEELDLHNANVQASERGVIVDDFLRSKTNRRVFAGGDAHGVRHLSPVASYEGRIIARNFLEGDVKPVDYSTIPQCIYT